MIDLLEGITTLIAYFKKAIFAKYRIINNNNGTYKLSVLQIINNLI